MTGWLREKDARMARLYSVKGWNKHYEKSQTRKVDNASWVPIPVKHDGKGFRRLMAMKDGAPIYGAWILMLQIAAKCPVRGVLEDEDGPLTTEDLAIKTGCPEALFIRALEVVTSKAIGWMLVAEWEGDGSTVELQDSTLQDNTEQEKTEDCPETVPVIEAAALLTFPTDGSPREWGLTQARVDTFRAAFPSLDVLAECRKALAWIEANPAKRKTPNGMSGYLFRWLSRTQDRGGGPGVKAARPALARLGDDA
jgi:hypothetical protein